MIPLLKVYRKRPLLMKLAKVQASDTGRTWIMTFVEPHLKFMQTVLIPASAEAGAVEALIEQMWVNWTERAKELEWLRRSGS